jgi:hypothetical protein
MGEDICGASMAPSHEVLFSLWDENFDRYTCENAPSPCHFDGTV